MQEDSYFNQAMGALGEVVKRDDLVELCVNPDGTVWVEGRGDHYMRSTDTRLSRSELSDLAGSIVGQAQATISKNKPLISASIEYLGRPIRVQVVAPPAALAGHAIAMRFFSTLPLEEIELKYLYGEQRSLDKERADRNKRLKEIASQGTLEDALRFCVQERLNIVLSGGTSTGKSVALRKIMSFIARDERIITIEDAAELLPRQPNTVALIADRNSTERSPDALLAATLRMRPDRLIVGEVRGKEAMTFLEAINTGHGGSMTTLHAETPVLALDRLAMAAGRSDVPMNYSEIRDYIRRSIDVIIQTDRYEGDRGIAEFFIPATEGTSA